LFALTVLGAADFLPDSPETGQHVPAALGTVVDNELQVRGFVGLRVGDASVMLAIPSPTILPATIVSAERGSATISQALAG
jgi:choline dehydrogenase-like flavoprotein